METQRLKSRCTATKAISHEEIKPKEQRRRVDETSGDKVPEEIIQDILLRLPIKSILKCTVVCKSWRSMIKSSAFIHTHLNRQNDGVQPLLRHTSKDFVIRDIFNFDRPSLSDYSLHWDNSPTFPEHSKLKNPFPAYFDQIKTHSASANTCTGDDRYVSVIGTCNGLVCLKHDNFTALIWNPCIRKFVILPPPSIPLRRDDHHVYIYTTYCFGYDSRGNDYKVLRTVTNTYNGRVSCDLEIWSLAGGSWKTLNASVIPANFSPAKFTHLACDQTFVNGALHWIHSIWEKSIILSFDMSTESFGTIMMPEALREKPRYISRYGESVAFFEENISYMEPSVDLSLWVMKEYGIAESWTKLCTVCLQPGVLGTLAVRKSGEVVLKVQGGEVIYYLMDPKTQKLNEFRIYGHGYIYKFMDYFTESLVLLDQPNASAY